MRYSPQGEGKKTSFCCISSKNFHNITGRGAIAFHRTFRTFTTSQEGMPMHFTELSELSQHHRKGCQCISQNFQNFHNITGRDANAFHRTFRTFTTSQEGCQCISQNFQNFHNILEFRTALAIDYKIPPTLPLESIPWIK